MTNNEDVNVFVGQKIRDARESEGLSQAELAKALKYESGTAISLIESGERKIKIEDLNSIAHILHRDIKYFLGQEEKVQDVKVALRADKNIPKKDQDAILHFIELAKRRHGKQ